MLRATALALLVVSMMVAGCDDDSGEKANNASNNAKDDMGTVADQGGTNNPSGYECPGTSDKFVDVMTTPEQGLGLNFKLPEDFSPATVAANETTDIIKLVRFDKMFSVTKGGGNYPQRLYRVEIEQMGPISTDIFAALNPPPYEPYGVGTGKPADGSEPNGAMDAGTMELGGQTVTIYRQVTDDYYAKFTVVREVGGEFYQLTVSTRIFKAAPVVIGDINATCVPSYDAIGLAVVKSIVLQ